MSLNHGELLPSEETMFSYAVPSWDLDQGDIPTDVISNGLAFKAFGQLNTAIYADVPLAAPYVKNQSIHAKVAFKTSAGSPGNAAILLGYLVTDEGAVLSGTFTQGVFITTVDPSTGLQLVTLEDAIPSQEHLSNPLVLTLIFGRLAENAGDNLPDDLLVLGVNLYQEG